MRDERLNSDWDCVILNVSYSRVNFCMWVQTVVICVRLYCELNRQLPHCTRPQSLHVFPSLSWLTDWCKVTWGKSFLLGQSNKTAYGKSRNGFAGKIFHPNKWRIMLNLVTTDVSVCMTKPQNVLSWKITAAFTVKWRSGGGAEPGSHGGEESTSHRQKKVPCHIRNLKVIKGILNVFWIWRTTTAERLKKTVRLCHLWLASAANEPRPTGESRQQKVRNTFITRLQLRGWNANLIWL